MLCREKGQGIGGEEALLPGGLRGRRSRRCLPEEPAGFQGQAHQSGFRVAFLQPAAVNQFTRQKRACSPHRFPEGLLRRIPLPQPFLHGVNYRDRIDRQNVQLLLGGRRPVGLTGLHCPVAVARSGNQLDRPEDNPFFVQEQHVAAPPHDLGHQDHRPPPPGRGEGQLQEALSGLLVQLLQAPPGEVLAQEHTERGGLLRVTVVAPGEVHPGQPGMSRQ